MFYVPLAIVVALTLGASLLVAFTFIPALASRVLPGVRRVEMAGAAAMMSAPALAETADGPARAARSGMSGGPAEGGEPGHSSLPRRPATPFYTRLYSTIIGFTLRHAWLAVTVAVMAFGGSYYLFENHVTRGVLWGGGMGLDTYVLINIELPRGSDLERTDNLVRSFEERLAAIPEIERFSSTVRGTYGQITINFPDSLENTGVPMAIKEQMFSYSLGFTGAEVRVIGRGLGFYAEGAAPARTTPCRCWATTTRGCARSPKTWATGWRVCRGCAPSTPTPPGDSSASAPPSSWSRSTGTSWRATTSPCRSWSRA